MQLQARSNWKKLWQLPTTINLFCEGIPKTSTGQFCTKRFVRRWRWVQSKSTLVQFWLVGPIWLQWRLLFLSFHSRVQNFRQNWLPICLSKFIKSTQITERLNLPWSYFRIHTFFNEKLWNNMQKTKGKILMNSLSHYTLQCVGNFIGLIWISGSKPI